ncbi:cadherin-like beta sandwich domain-containing protein [Paenibacillus sp. S-38]|uniref:rhamnogalacturonan lyase family protein n=1 Tax=Paenibacillus sp. S-38 TaxID=3416710 RepID=UPI003CF1D5B0
MLERGKAAPAKLKWSKLMIVLLVLAMVFPVAPPAAFAADSVLADDNFGSYAPGPFTVGSGNNWTKEGSTPDMTVVQDTVTGRTYGSITNNTTGSIYVGQRFTAQGGGMIMEFDANMPTSKGGTLWVMDGKVNATSAAALRYQMDAGVIKRGGSSTTNVVPYDVTHWYRFKIVFNIPGQVYTITMTDLNNGKTVSWNENFYSSRSKISSFGFYVNPGGGTINLTNVRLTSLDLSLADLKLASEGYSPKLSPVFDPTVESYEVEVPSTTDRLTVIPTAGNPGNVKVKVGETGVDSGMSADVPITEASTNIAVSVTSAVYSDISRTYTIHVTKLEKSPNLKFVATEPRDSEVKIGWEETLDPTYQSAHIYQVNADQGLTLVDTVPKGTYISTVKGLTNGNTYTFIVKGFYADGTESSGVTVQETPVKFAPRQMESLNRGLVAMKTQDGVYAGWRLLGTDPGNAAFNLYRDGVKVNTSPITGSTNMVDPAGTGSSTYFVRTVVDGVEQKQSETVKVWDTNYLSVPLRKPADGVTVSGEAYSYRANDATTADLDGDGEYEIILKWDPTNAKDNSQSGYTGSTLVDAYRMDGTFLWRIDLGRNIRAGAHYLDMMAYDLDGDGRAEVTFRTADGTIDGQGNVIGDTNADWRNSSGYILTGPEYHTIFEGATGKALATEAYEPERGNVSDWGDAYGNRVDRFLAAVAYLDGERPSVIMQRGYYTRMVLVAYNWRDGKLTKLWTFDSNTPGNEAYRGQGNHQLSVADVDGDGRDEIITGAAAIDDNGTGLWSSGLGHGDAMHLSDLNPDRLGLEEWAVQENTAAEYSAEMKDAKTGRVLWGQLQVGIDVGRGLSADIDPTRRGEEVWAIDGEWNSTTGGLFSAKGEKISGSIPSSNFAVWWDGDLSRELLDHNWTTTPVRQGTPKIDKWDYVNNRLNNLVTFEGTSSNNDTKGNPSLQADLFGDWREEVMVRTDDSSELRIYSTTDRTDHRFVTLMHDPVYRLGIAWQNTGYNQPPHLSYYLGNGMEQPPVPNIRTHAVPASELSVYAAADEVAAGGQLSFFPVVTPSAANVGSVNWSVTGVDGSPTSLASIDAKGTLTAASAGTVKVTAAAADGSGLTGSRSITIKGVSVTAIQVTAEGNVTEFTGPGSLPFHAAVTPGSATNPAVKWSVTDLNGAATNIAKVTDRGVLQTSGAGFVKVRAAAQDGSGITGEAVLRVKHVLNGTLTLPVKTDAYGKVSEAVASQDIRKMIQSAGGDTAAVALQSSTTVKEAQIRVPLQEFSQASKKGIKRLQLRIQSAKYTVDMGYINNALKKGATTLILTVDSKGNFKTASQ